MARFVLVHGAWHGGWCFDPLAAELSGRGHDVEAVDLPCADITQTQYQYAERIGPQPEAVVVGHSLGGLTIPLVAARVRVYLAAILPVSNVYADSLAPGFGGVQRDRLGRSYWADIETAAASLYPDCDRAAVDWAFPQLRHQAPLVAQLMDFGPGDVSIACLRDALVTPEWQVRMGKERFGRAYELDSGHFPMITQPAELADLLESVA